MIVRPFTLLAVALAAGCAAQPPQTAPDPAAVAANLREQAKLAALAECHLQAQEATGADWGAGTYAAFVDRCMSAQGYLRQDLPVAGVGG